MKLKKYIIFTIIILVLIFTSIFSYIKLNKPKTLVNINNDLTLEYGEIAYISDYVSIDFGTLIDQEIIYNDLGMLTVNYSYIDQNNKEYNSSFNIEVIDTTKPLVMLGETFTTQVGKNNLIDKIMCADNFAKNPKCEIKGDYDVNKLGNYPLTFIASDSNNNITKIDFTLKVIKDSPSYKTTRTYFDNIIKNYKTDSTSIGIDVSRWQGDIDFKKVKDAGAEFVMIRIGIQDGFNGENTIDKYFKYNIEEALKNDLEVGVYFYSYATTTSEAINQANWVLDNIKNYDITLPIVFDWESWSSFNKLDISLFDITNIQESFLDRIKSAGYKTARYGSKNYLEKVFLETKHDTWLAHYTTSTNYKDDYFMWQMCSDGKIDGINGNVDINIMYK